MSFAAVRSYFIRTSDRTDGATPSDSSASPARMVYTPRSSDGTSSRGSTESTMKLPKRPESVATLEFQRDLISDFWSGGRPANSKEASWGQAVERGARRERLAAEKARKTEEREPRTLARTLFFLGFLFPLAWLAGVAFLCAPLRRPWHVDPEAPQTIPQQVALLTKHRKAEERWAKRCLWAFVAVLAVAVVVSVTVVMALRH